MTSTTISTSTINITTSGINASLAGNVTSNLTDYDMSYESWLGGCPTLYCILVTHYRNAVHHSLVVLSSLLGVIGLVGIIGNSIVITVFVRTTSKHTSMYFMLMLAIMDLMVCTLVIPEVIWTQWRIEVKYDAVCKVFEMLRFFSIPTSAMILVAIACDRYILICTQPSVRMTKFVSKIIMGVILAIGLAFSIPPILGTGVYAMDDYGGQIYIGYCVPNDLYITAAGLDIYWYVITAVFALMILVIFSMYILIFIRLYKQNKKWQIRVNKVHPVRLESVEDDNSSMLGERNKSVHSIPPQPQNSKEILSISAIKHLVPSLPATILESNIQPRTPSPPQPTVSYDNQRVVLKTPICQRPQYGKSQSEFFELPKKSVDLKRLSVDGTKNSSLQSGKAKVKPGPSNSLIMRTVHTAGLMARRFSNTSQEYKVSLNKAAKRIRPESKWNTIKESVLNNGFSNPRNRKKSTIVPPPKKDIFQTGQKSRRPMHIKTTQVLFIVTLVYVVSFLPTFLMSNNVIPNHRVLYHMYFINNAANPIIYSFMNQRFRKEVMKLFCDRR